MTDPVHTVVDALAGLGFKVVAPRTSGGQWSAQCPSHDDKAPSLSITEGREGRALLHCHAGCDAATIVSALGLNVVQLFPAADGDAAPDLHSWRAYREALSEGTSPPKLKPETAPRIERAATYIYTDADGQPVARVVRSILVDAAGEQAAKTFRQHAADGRGGWKPTLDGLQPPLYQLPRVLAAVAAKLPILVVEGEKDADAAAAIGLVATCNPMGAGAWREHHTATLAGASVLLVPDRDEPGVKHARDVRDALRAAGSKVAVFGAAHGKDLSDHLEAGLNLADLTPVDLDNPEPFLNPDADHEQPDPTPDAEKILQRLVDTELRNQKARRIARRMLDAEEAAQDFRTPPFRPTLTAELALPEEPITYRLDLLAPTGANITLTAQYKTGKTTVVNELVRSLADNVPFLGRFAPSMPDGRIAVFNYEVDDRQYRRWLREVGISNTDRVSLLNLRGYRLPLISGHIEDWVVGWLTDHDIKVWVVDPFARAYVGAGDENSNADVGRFLDTLDVIKERAHVSELLMPVHTGRDAENAERARGATRIDDWTDVRWVLTKDDEDQRYFRATGRDVEIEEEKLTYDTTTRRVVFGGGNREWEERRRLEVAVEACVKNAPGINWRDLRKTIMERYAVGAGKVDAARDACSARNLIRTEKGANNSTLHFPRGVEHGS